MPLLQAWQDIPLLDWVREHLFSLWYSTAAPFYGEELKIRLPKRPNWTSVISLKKYTPWRQCSYCVMAIAG